MTEEEAGKKWCPMVRFHIGYNGDVYSNKLDGTSVNLDETCCIASKCMMWRIQKTTMIGEGYCGLAGKGDT